MTRVRFHGAALDELSKEVSYYAAVAASLGERFVVAIENATRLATDFPLMGVKYKYGARQVFPKRFPFSLVYLVRDDAIYILALAPFSKQPGYWRSRRHEA